MNRQQQIDAFLLAAHELAGQRLRAAPSLLGQVQQQMQRWRAQVGENRADPLWDEWERLLNAPMHELLKKITERSDHGDQLRSVSPMSALITQTERAELLLRCRTTA